MQPLIDLGKLRAKHAALCGKVRYVWGAKPTSDADAIAHGSDCSGYKRRLMLDCGTGFGDEPEGSVNQLIYDEKSLGLKVSDDGTGESWHAGLDEDGTLREFFLPPLDGEAGHTGFVIGGETIECCASEGACSRPWTGDGWQKHCILYVVPTETID